MAMMLADCYEAFLTDMEDLRQLSLNTIRAYRYELAAAARDEQFCCGLDALSRALLERWLTRPPAAPSTISRRAATFTRFFAWARAQDLCAVNPLHDRPSVRIPRRLPRPIRTRHERSIIDAAIIATPMPYRLIFTILRETGMRVNEVLQLRVRDVILDRSREALRIGESKNGSERIVILGPTATPRTLRRLRVHLKTLGHTGPQELLFRSNRGTRLSYDAVHYQWVHLCRRAQLVDATEKPLYTLHQLRHTRGSELLEQGHRLEVVQRVLGHRDLRSTLAYAELTEYHLREALEGMSD